MTEPPETQQDQLSRIRKLLEKAESVGPSPEAEALTERASMLASKYEIDLALARQQGKPSKDDVIINRVFDVGRPFLYQIKLAYNVYINNGCNMIQQVGAEGGRKLRGRLHVFGYRSDMARADMLFTSLVLQASREAASRYRAYVDNFTPTTCSSCDNASFRQIHVDPEWSRCIYCGYEVYTAQIRNVPERRPTWYRSFWQGWVTELIPRLERSRKSAMSSASATSTGASVELALRSRDDQVASAMKQVYANSSGSVRRDSQRQLRGSGYISGREAARLADVGHDRIGKRRELQ